MSWTCPSCGQEWPEKPFVDGTIGCPECGSLLAQADCVGDVIAADGDGTIILDDGITTWNPQRAALFLARERDSLRGALGRIAARLSAAEQALREIAADDVPRLPRRQIAADALAALAGREEQE